MQNENQNGKQEWVYCPVCGNKTRLRLREDTILTHFPLFCPKCKKEKSDRCKGICGKRNKISQTLRRSADCK